MDILTVFRADTTQMKDADRLVKKVGVTTEQTSKKVSNLGRNMRLTKGPTSALSTTAGQLGVQFQDVAVQAQMGTDAVRIFSQQGPQILSVFGPKGAVIGALAAIGGVIITTVIEAFSQGEEAIKSFADASKEVNDAVNELSDGTLGLAESIVELSQKSDAAARLQISLALEAADIAARRARESFHRLGLEGEGMYRGIEGADRVTRDFAVVLEDVVRNGKVSADTMSVFNRASQDLGISLNDITSLADQFVKATDPNADAKTLVEFGETLAGLAEKVGTGNSGFKTYILNLLETALKAQDAEERARLLEQALTDLSGAVGSSDDKAVQFVERMERMAEEAGKTREEILRLQAAQIQDPALRARAEEAIEQIERQRKAEEDAAEAKKKADADEAFRQRLQRVAVQKTIALRKEADREEQERLKQVDAERKEREERVYQEQLRMMKNRFEVFKVNQEQQEEYEQRVADEQLRRMREKFEEFRVQEEERKRIQATTTNALLAFEDKLLEGKSEKQKAAYRLAVNLADAEKRENAKQIVSDSYSAAMKAYKSLAGIPIIGPALGAAAAGVIIAAGASYATQSLAGRALGGQVRDGESYVVGERGPEVLTMGSNGRIIPNEKLSAPSQTNNQNVSVSFNITATDASGFDQLLQARRGMIIGMINQAMNNRGRKALV